MPINPAIAKIGVEAVVSKLGDFLGDMNKIDGSIKGLTPSSTLLGRAFSSLGDIMSGVASFVANTLAHALGELLADAVQWVVKQIQELISTTIEAAGEFQKLELRLNTLNFNAMTESGMDYEQATKASIKATQEQLTWLQKLAALTPYDNVDISNVYTLARGYGFVDEEARDLVETIVDFTSGMGLGNTEMTRIIKNFGQMQSMGKVMQRDLNDLATGAFVPVNKILAQMRLETGLTGDAFDDFRNSGEGVELFLSTFTKMVESDFGGAAQKMARTFGAATDNVKDFIKSVVGLNVIKPILDVLGGRIADFMDELTEESRWDTIVGLANRIGKSLSRIVKRILLLAPHTSAMADGIVGAFKKVADWLDAHSRVIITWVQESAAWIRGELVPRIIELRDWLFGTDEKRGAIQAFGAWLNEEFIPRVIEAAEWVGNVLVPFLRDDLVPVFESLVPLGGAVADVLLAALGGEPDESLSEWIHNKLIPAISDLQTWIEDNKDMLADWVKAFAALQVILLVASYIGVLFGWVLSVVGAIWSFIAILSFIGVTISAVVVVPILVLIALVAVLAEMWKQNGEKIKVTLSQLGFLFGYYSVKFWEYIYTSFNNIAALIGNRMYVAWNSVVTAFTNIWNSVREWLGKIVQTVQTKFEEVRSKITEINWSEVGRSAIQGIINGISGMIPALIQAAKNAALAAFNAAKNALNARSPSKLFMELGKFTMEGMAIGIADSAKLAAKAMAGAMQSVSLPAMQTAQMAMRAMPSNTVTNNNTNNYNLAINTNAQTEPILQDFAMLESLA